MIDFIFLFLFIILFIIFTIKLINICKIIKIKNCNSYSYSWDFFSRLLVWSPVKFTVSEYLTSLKLTVEPWDFSKNSRLRIHSNIIFFPITSLSCVFSPCSSLVSGLALRLHSPPHEIIPECTLAWARLVLPPPSWASSFVFAHVFASSYGLETRGSFSFPGTSHVRSSRVRAVQVAKDLSAKTSKELIY